ncbi:MAG: ATP-binding protein [Paludibacteraceae bacterium]|nr:ATP-binding protein [Paludibacteraceae bacterium]
MEVVSRKKYADEIEAWIGKGLVVVLTGQRRVGKSCLLKDFIQRHENDIESNLIYIDKEKKNFNFIKTDEQLNDYIDSQLLSDKHNYILIDEVQNILRWERSVRSYITEENIDIIITGSNSQMLSGELSTLIGGRYKEVYIQSLTYKEFLEFHKLIDSDDSLMKFINYGGLPGLKMIGLDDDDMVNDYFKSVYSTVVLKDIIECHQIRNVSFLNRLITFIADTIGKPNSATSISKYMKSQNLGVTSNLVLDYIRYLNDAFIISDVKRFDIHGKKILESNGKSYFGDIGLRNYCIGGERENDIEKIIENIVYLQLIYDGYEVKIGHLQAGEIDFVCTKKNSRAYIQVSYIIANEETRRREFGQLRKIEDHYPKYVISVTPFVRESDDNGIRHLGLRHFLMNGL